MSKKRKDQKRRRDFSSTDIPPVKNPLAAPDLTVPPVELDEKPGTPFFMRIDWLAFWVATIISFAVYVYTLAPTVTLEDSGELAVAGDHLGVPHPPGYPSWTMLVWIFSKLFWFARFRGQPNPAWSIALASAVFGALAAGFSALLVCRSGRDMLRSMKRTTEMLGLASENVICFAGAVAASLIFAFSPVMWSQTVIVEVYSLNALFLVLVLLFSYMWIRRPSDKVMILTGLVFGVGLTNYQVLLLLMTTLLFVIMVKDLKLFRDFILFGVFLGLGIILMITGAVILKNVFPALGVESVFPQVDTLRTLPTKQWLIMFALPWKLTALIPTFRSLTFYGGISILIVNILVLILTYVLLPRGKTVALTILATQIGLALYAYMPISSDFNPPMNWGYPRTWEGFKHATSRGQYEQIVPTDIFSMTFVHQIGDYASDLRTQFTLPIAILGFLPFTVWAISFGKRRFRAVFAASVLTAIAAGLVAIEEITPHVAARLPLLDNGYRLATLIIVLLMCAGGMALVLNQIADFAGKLRRSVTASLADRLTVGLVLLAIGGVYLFYAFSLFTHMANPALGLVLSERIMLLLLILLPLLAALFISILMHHRATMMEPEFDRDSQKWILSTVCSFLVLSIVLIALANPKGDIQDAFIQKVKFISSHALFSFWIGYGLIFGLAFVDTLFRGNRFIKAVGVSVVLLLPLIPIGENAYNRELIRVMGGAEQTGHDFGWQFGNYQLRGADAITEELSPEEEPLPNPSYPPEMGPKAIFYGGTDPGRFVPTYMIFSAHVREDVYLITQNALADNTYMSVMRDLYGDEIWIPTPRESNNAFQRYIDDVRNGRISASADIRIENGRVSVQGVGGVMLINGILAQMIFERNRLKHDFYVEESYVIQWMYPYLTPHGLIMKINRDTLPSLSEATVRDDLDFWDWYTRRLTSNPAFRRDVVAQKSFSKLRSAIAGLYAVRGMFPQAEIGFKEALDLYILSPEANFRLADLYLRWNRMDEAIKVMKDFALQDPANSRARDFAREIIGRKEIINRRKILEDSLNRGSTDINQALELADIYRRLGLSEAFTSLCQNLLNTPQIPPQTFLRVAQMAVEEKRYDLMAMAMEKYVDRVPADAKAWLDLATIKLLLSKSDEALRAVQSAVRVGGDEILRILREDQRFDPIRQRKEFMDLTRDRRQP